MTLKEKQDKQKAIIDELYASIQEKPTSIEKHASFFREKITEIFHIEMDYYQIKYPEKANIKFGDINNSNLYGLFSIKAFITSDWKLVLETPLIEMRDSDLINLLKNEKKAERLDSCKEMLHTLFHEITHLRRYYMAVYAVSDIVSLREAKENILTNVLWDKELYRSNADVLASEAEANYNGYIELENSLSLDKYTNIRKYMSRSDMHTAFLLTPTHGIIDRDEYIDGAIEEFMLTRKGLEYRFYLRILGKEYDGRGKPRRLWDLIERYRKEIGEVEASNKTDDEKKKLLDGINSLYFELFNKRLLKNSRFEFYEALFLEGVENVEYLLNILKWYNAQEKNRKSALVKDKLKSQISADIFLYNAGYIANPFKDYKGIITPDEYIDSIDIKTENPDMLEYFRSKKYKNIIPVFGYYILKSGVKVSVHEFINDFAIKELEKVKPDKYHAIYEDTVFKECKRSEEEEAQFTFETINKRYQALNKIITNLLHLRVFKGKKETNIVGAYSRDLVSSMETVVNICNGDEDFFKEFGSAPYDSSQILLYDELKRVAIVLSSDETFNPNKINYYNKLIKNAKFIKLGKDIEKYVKMSNEKGGKKK